MHTNPRHRVSARRCAWRRPWPALAFCAGLILAVLGCAQKAAFTPVPESPALNGYSAGAKSTAVVIADMDNDGRPDVVAGCADPGAVSISYGEGGGRMSVPHLLATEGDVRSVAVADVNEDGLPDIVYSVQRQSSGIRVWLNQGGRRWKQAKGPIDINKYEGVKSADLNGDGHIDIVAANASSDTQGGIQVWWGTGQGTWVPAPSPTVTGVFMDVLIADFNADGILDIAGAGWGTHGALRVWLGNGAGQWTAKPTVKTGNFYMLNAVDINKDGRTDILAGTYQDGVYFFQGDGTGGFTEAAHLKPRPLESAADGSAWGDALEQSSFWQALAVDLNGDGRPEVVAGSLDHHGVYAWSNADGKGWKPYAADLPRRGNFYGLAAADLNADGQSDVCGANWGEGVVIWPGRAPADSGPRTAMRRSPGATEPAQNTTGPAENDVFKLVNGVPEYKIGPGDSLEITFWEGNTSTRQELLVRPDGRISFGLVENLKVSGLTVGELDSLLTQRFQQFYKRPRVDVLVKQYKSKSVKVMGALDRLRSGASGTGEYVLQGKTSVLDVLTSAGGPASDADLKSVRVRRKSGETVSLNLYRTIIQGDLSQDLVLNDGDLIYLPTLAKEANRVYVFGEVQKPGAYTFSGSEMRLIDAISEAGGTTVFAYRPDTKVVRGDITQPEILSADLARLMERGDRSQNVLLASGDMIYVPRSAFGDIKLFYDQVRPLLELVLWPARVVIDWKSAADITGVR